MIDCHLHSKFSHDGRQTLDEIIDRAKALGMRYIAITEHLDRDYLYCGLMERFASQLNLAKYEKGFREATAHAGDLEIAFGVECGYSAPAVEQYQKDLAAYPFDVIINAVHSVGKHDLYTVPPAKKPPREAHYKEYLNAVLQSVHAPYDYDIIAHIGYAARYVNYEDRTLYYDKTAALIDDILKSIIEKGKTLELNAHAKSLGLTLMPEYEIIKRYRALGGTQLSFGSDAHTPNRIGEDYAAAAALAKELGFTHWTVYKNRQPRPIAFE